METITLTKEEYLYILEEVRQKAFTDIKEYFKSDKDAECGAWTLNGILNAIDDVDEWIKESLNAT